MADEWWISSARATDDDGNGTSPCSTTAPPMDQNLDAAESSGTSTTTATADFRPALHVDAAAPPPPTCFLADPPLQLHHMDWTQAAYICMGGRAAAASASAGPTTSLYALLQPDGDASGRHFPLDHQQLHVDGAVPMAAAAAQSASMYAGNQLYSSYGDVPPFPGQQEFSSGFFGSSAPLMTKPLLLQALEQKAFKSQTEPPQDACSSATRSVPPGSPAPAKKPRVATPSPLPTFKVRKEKLGDRITALQQLVSPFGKTDTASVLHEAIEYIRFLHDQVASLSSPYLRCGRPVQQLQQQKSKDGGEAKEDLRSRGLCLVPLTSTTYAVASETAPELWPPTFGGTLYR